MLNTTGTPDNDNNGNKEESSNMETQTTVIDPNEFALISQNLAIVADQAKELEAHAKELLEKLQRARGTADVTEVANQVARQAKQPRPVGRPPGKTKPPKDQVETALRGVSMNTGHLVKATGLSVNKVTEALRTLRADQKVVNVGSEDFPQWTMRIGDRASTQDLNAEVKRLITERPMTTQELMHFTGARLTRVSGALINLQRTENQLLNRGTARRAKWFLVDDRAVISRLSPKS